MATLLETLFTAGDQQSEEIGYRLRKRVSVLMSWKFPEIESDLKGLYSDRSEFVHGGFYKKIIKKMKKNERDPDTVPNIEEFEDLLTEKYKVRMKISRNSKRSLLLRQKLLTEFHTPKHLKP